MIDYVLVNNTELCKNDSQKLSDFIVSCFTVNGMIAFVRAKKNPVL